MSKKKADNVSEEWLEDIPANTRVESYKDDQMISCAKCSRKTPPNRLDCIYCGVKLELSAEQTKNLKPTLRKTDTWKNALNLIFVSVLSEPTDRAISEIAKMTRLEHELVTTILEYPKPLPLARSEQAEELEIVSARLNELGIKSVLVGDEELEPDVFPQRLRKVGFKDGNVEFSLFNRPDTIICTPGDLMLIVTGALYERRVESSEKHIRKKENKILDLAETSVDELLIDIYDRENVHGFRISANGFDFSCLGNEKGMIANDNMRTIAEKICQFSPEAELDEDYLKLRGVLAGVWEVDEQVDSKGLKRKGLGGYKRETVTTTTNLKQFTKYSRLRRHLNESEKK